jgi:hypothetical protein
MSRRWTLMINAMSTRWTLMSYAPTRWTLMCNALLRYALLSHVSILLIVYLGIQVSGAEQSRAERVPTEHNAFQRRSTGADQLLNALNRGGTVSTTEYSTLELLNTDQLAQLNPVRMPNGTIGRIHARAHLQMCAHSECLVVVGILNVYDLYG